MDVSIIIVNWNTRELLYNCVKSVYEQAGDVDFEVIVVDNASQDDSCEMMRKHFPEATLIVNSINRGYAGAVNRGIKTARGRYVLVLNSDILICDSAIEKTVRYADEHPEAAVVGCRVEEDNNKIHPTCRRFPSLLNLLFEVTRLNRIFAKSRLFGREYMLWWNRDSQREVDVVSGMFMLVRRKAINQIGMMDEAYFFLFEETDWCYRFAKAGWKMLFWPGAKIIHAHGGGQSRKKAGVKINVHFQKGMLIFFRKHYGRFQTLVARAILIIHSITCFLVWWMLRISRNLFGKDVEYAKNKTLAYRWILLFCILGMEPDKGGVKHYIKKIFKAIKNGIEMFFAASYWMISRLFGKSPEKVILCYHAVKPWEKDGFEKQMSYLSKSCRVVKLSDIITAGQNGTRPTVAIIFDDAFESVRDNAIPALDRYMLTATLAVPTGVMGKSLDWWQENGSEDNGEMVLDEEEIARLNQRGYGIISHTVSHPHLTKLDKTELKKELGESKLTLEKTLGHKVDCIVYPYGAFNPAVCEAAAEAGYKFGFSVEPKTVCQLANPLCIGRFNVSPCESMFGFKLKTQGAYRHISRLRQIKRLLTGYKN